MRWRLTKTGKTAVVDCGMIKGKRVRFFFKTMEEAATKAGQLRVQRMNEGQIGMDLTVSERLDASESLALLGPHGQTLRQAVDFFEKSTHHSIQPGRSGSFTGTLGCLGTGWALGTVYAGYSV